MSHSNSLDAQKVTSTTLGVFKKRYSSKTLTWKPGSDAPIQKNLLPIQDFLGPNYEEVLEFWVFVDTLTKEDKNRKQSLYADLDYSSQMNAWHSAIRAADKVVSPGSSHIQNVLSSVNPEVRWRVFEVASLELMGNVKNKVAYDLITNQ
jgi:hypothetical protein